MVTFTGLFNDTTDYFKYTIQIMEVADICCHGRVVSVLEGGYGSSNEVSSENSLLDKSMISDCAMSHIQAMVDPRNVERRRTGNLKFED